MQATSVTLYFLVATFLKKETKEINFNIFHFTSYICCVNTQSLSTTLFIFSPKSSKIQQTSIHSRHVSSFQLLLLQETSLLRSVLRKSCFHWCPSLKHKLLVWVCRGYYNKIPQTGDYQQQKLISQSSGGWMPQIGMPGTLLPRRLILSSCDGRTGEHCGVFFIRAFSPLMRVPPSWPNGFPKALPCNNNTLDFRISTHKLWEDTNIQTIAVLTATSFIRPLSSASTSLSRLEGEETKVPVPALTHRKSPWPWTSSHLTGQDPNFLL